MMPSELRKAHQLNDRAVMEAYGFWGKSLLNIVYHGTSHCKI